MFRYIYTIIKYVTKFIHSLKKIGGTLWKHITSKWGKKKNLSFLISFLIMNARCINNKRMPRHLMKLWNQSHTKNQCEKMLKQTGPFCQNVIGATHHKVEAPNETKDDVFGVLLPDLTRPGHHWASLWGNLGPQNGLGNNVLEVFYWPRPGELGGLNSFILQESPAHSSHWVWASSCAWRNSGPAARE